MASDPSVDSAYCSEIGSPQPVSDYDRDSVIRESPGSSAADSEDFCTESRTSRLCRSDCEHGGADCLCNESCDSGKYSVLHHDSTNSVRQRVVHDSIEEISEVLEHHSRSDGGRSVHADSIVESAHGKDNLPDTDIRSESYVDRWEWNSSGSYDMATDDSPGDLSEGSVISHNEVVKHVDDDNEVDFDDAYFDDDDGDDDDEEEVEESSGNLSPTEWLLKDDEEDRHQLWKASFLLQKSSSIQAALSAERVDVEELRRLAMTEGGLLKCQWRRKVWPLLADCTDDCLTTPLFSDESDDGFGPCLEHALSTFDNEEMKCNDTGAAPYRDHQQVVMDVRRTLGRFPPRLPLVRRSAVQRALVRLIVAVLSCRPHLHYYQGFHDVALTVLLVFSGRASPTCRRLLTNLSVSRLRPFLAPTMQPSGDLLTYMTVLIEVEDSELAVVLAEAEVGTVFALPWLLTWFSHVLPSSNCQLRVFDWVLACHPLSPLYLAAALVLSSRDRLLAAGCEMAVLHVQLSRLPASMCVDGWELALDQARDLMQRHPPSSLQSRVQQLNAERSRQERLLMSRKVGRTAVGRAAVMVRVAGAAAILVVAVAAQWWWSSQH